MSGFRPFTPADGPAWLPRFADSIADLFRRILPGPLRLRDYPSAGLPAAADFAQGLAWDRGAANVAVSDGAAWRCWSFDDHGHAAADVAFTAAVGSLAADNVQAALEELDSEKAAAGHSHRNACMVRKAADQTAANYSAGGFVAWDQEVYDDGGWHNNAVNNSRLTVPSGVTRVRAGANIYIQAYTAPARMEVAILRNGTAAYDGLVDQVGYHSSGTIMIVSCASGPIPVAPGDYLECFVIAAGDTSVTLRAVASNFWAEALN